MAGFHNDDEQASWAMAEQLMEKGRLMMRQAEHALERFMIGKEMNRQRCLRRGIGDSDAEIRWSETSNAQKALSDTNFNMTQAMMYYGAAAAHYSRATYLRGRGSRATAR
jgi:hypothetical protein